MPQDRLRKLNDDNRELALQLKKDAEAMRRPSKKSTTNRKSNVGADNSARGSEERHSSVATSANVRTLKRGRDDVEKVSFSLSVLMISVLSHRPTVTPISRPKTLHSSYMCGNQNSEAIMFLLMVCPHSLESKNFEATLETGSLPALKS